MFKKKKESILPVVKLEPELSKGEWMQKYWRPCAAFMYMICCLCDFAVFPIMFTVVQFWEEQAANDAFRQWVPITLQGGGLFHVSMCAVLGVSAYGRTQEKLAGQAQGLPSQDLTTGANNATPTTNASFATPAPTAGSNFGSSATAGGFGSAPAASAPSTSGFGSSSFNDTPTVVTGFGGKPAPVIPPFPEK